MLPRQQRSQRSCTMSWRTATARWTVADLRRLGYPKALMCRALGLSRSGHHAYSTRGPSRRALKEQQLDVLVAAIFAELGGRYGAPRIEQELRRRGSAPEQNKRRGPD